MNKILLHDISDSVREEIVFALDSIDENCHLREVLCTMVDNHYVLRKT